MAETKAAAKAREAKEMESQTAGDDFDAPDAPEVEESEEYVPQSYVHLANGQVKRVRTEDIPQGGHNHYGHWVQDGKAHTIIGVYPVEESVAK